MINQEYSLAISETLDILNHTKKADVEKISERFLKFLKENASKTYVSTIDFNKPLKEMNLNPKTIGILSIINKKFWCNDEQKKEFDRILKQNELIYQNELREKYNPDNIFKNRNNNIEESNNSFEERSIAIIPQEKWYQKIFNIVKRLFKREQ